MGGQHHLAGVEVAAGGGGVGERRARERPDSELCATSLPMARCAKADQRPDDRSLVSVLTRIIQKAIGAPPDHKLQESVPGGHR